MFSATFSDDIKKLAQDFLVNPVTVEAERRNTAAENVKQSVLLVDQENKFTVLSDQIRSRGVKQVLVFTRTKLSAASVAKMLARDGIPSDAIHGDKTQQERIKALDDFKEGKITALVATDVAARGLDIDQLPLVVNYELPTNAEDYVHRIGRTGRAGASGEALSLVDEKEERLLKDIEKLLKREFPRERAVFRPIAHASSSHRASRYSAPTHGRKTTPEEDWFLRPYVPTPSTLKAEEQPLVSENKPKKQLAALLCRPQVKS